MRKTEIILSAPLKKEFFICRDIHKLQVFPHIKGFVI